MALPGKLLERLQETRPELEFHHWVYGFFNTAYGEPASGLKGIIAAAEDRLVFFGRNGAEEEMSAEIPFSEIRYIQAVLNGTAKVVCKTGAGNAEISYISRGDAAGFIAHLETNCGIEAEKS
ncbi:hypothetical protein [Indiicoccus explosivorum]|uniref:hypothetical protein n=1 Tax=Indiicoccus explosivorum TaxID=1917864 RepID=UPI000B43992A|nr:hypothetical protein [Indiicoccus explosivorum]